MLKYLGECIDVSNLLWNTQKDKMNERLEGDRLSKQVCENIDDGIR